MRFEIRVNGLMELCLIRLEGFRLIFDCFSYFFNLVRRIFLFKLFFVLMDIDENLVIVKRIF